MNKLWGAGLTALLTASVIAGCGGSDSNATSYCDDLKNTKAQVQALGNNQMTQDTFDKLTGALENIASEAPSDVADDWSALETQLRSFRDALQAAGLNMDDLQKLSSGGGSNIDPTKLQAILKAAKSLSSSRIKQATQNINAEVQKECGFKLGVGS